MNAAFNGSSYGDRIFLMYNFKINEMKSFTLFAVLLCLTMGLSAQRKQLPPAVSDSLVYRYPDASDMSFSKRKDQYRIKLRNEGVKTTAVFDESGNWKSTESLYLNEQIPEKVQKTVAKKYPKGSFKSALLKETSEGLYTYEVTVDTERVTYYLELDKAGKIVKTSQSEKSGGDSERSYSTSDDGGGDE